MISLRIDPGSIPVKTIQKSKKVTTLMAASRSASLTAVLDLPLDWGSCAALRLAAPSLRAHAGRDDSMHSTHRIRRTATSIATVDLAKQRAKQQLQHAIDDVDDPSTKRRKIDSAAGVGTADPDK